jgi:hypothetical protein
MEQQIDQKIRAKEQRERIKVEKKADERFFEENESEDEEDNTL